METQSSSSNFQPSSSHSDGDLDVDYDSDDEHVLEDKPEDDRENFFESQSSKNLK